MGIFTEYQTSTAFIAVDLGDVSTLGASLAQQVLRNSLQTTDITPALLEENLNSIDYDGEAYYQYGATKYIHRLPTVKLEEVSLVDTFSFFPFATIRKDKVNRYNPSVIDNANVIDAEHKSTNELLTTMGFSLETISGGISESPDIASIDDCYFGFTVPLLSGKNEHIEYLMAFWEQLNHTFPLDKRRELTGQELYTKQPYEVIDPETYETETRYRRVLLTEYPEGTIANSPKTDNYTSISLAQDGLDLYVNFTGLEVTTKSTVIGAIGSRQVNKLGNKLNDQTKLDDNGLVIPYVERNQDHSSVEYLEQVTATTCKVITVYNLQVASVNKNRTNMIHANSDTDDFTAFTLPLEHTVLEGLKLPIQEEILNSTISLLLNAYQKEKLKWYQTTLFKVALIVVAIVIIAFTGQAWVANLLLAIEEGIVAVLVFLAVTVALGYITGIVLNLAAQYVIEHWGMEAAAIFAVVTVLVAAILAGSGVSTDVSFAGEFLFNVSSVSLQYLNATVDAINEIIQEGFALLAEEQLAFTEMLEEREAAIVEAQATLYMNHDLLNMLARDGSQVPYFNFNESPDEFYNRTVHTQNVGVYANEVSRTFIERSLTLPRVGEDIFTLV